MTSKPKFSIIIPAYNEERNLPKFHEAIQKIDLFPESELIYIDDCSTDKSWEILQSFEQGERLRIFRLDRNYPVGYVRAFGVNKAKGEYIASIDADCIPTSNWLTMIKYLDDETAVVGFPVFPPPEYDYLDQKFKYIGNGKPESSVHLHGSGVILKKEIVLNVGNYPCDKRVGEDTALFNSLVDFGYKIKYTDEVKIYHSHRQNNLWSFLRRFYKTGLNATSLKTFILFDIIFVLLILLIIPFVYLFGIIGLTYFLIPLIFMANPLTIAKYIKNFNKPRNPIVKAAFFTIVKIIISFAYIIGIWKATYNMLSHRDKNSQ